MKKISKECQNLMITTRIPVKSVHDLKQASKLARTRNPDCDKVARCVSMITRY